MAILIGLGITERKVYIKNNKKCNKISLVIGIIITCLLFLMAYMITDTGIGVFYIFLSFTVFIIMGIAVNRVDVERIKCISFLMGWPVLLFLLLKASQNMLVNVRCIFLFLSIISLVLNDTNKRKSSIKENVSLGVGILITGILIFSYYNFSGVEDRIMMKQELVAQNYLQEELDIYDATVYLNGFNGSLRGEESRVNASHSSGKYITMIYKNNKIISYDIESYDEES